MIPQDWLHVGAQMVERLRASVPELRQVRMAVSIAELGEITPAAPAAWVVWDGDQIADDARSGASQSVDQRWLVVLIVRSAKEADAGGGVVTEAGPLMSEVLSALMGWTPMGGMALRRTTAPTPGYQAGYGYYPLAFTCRIVASGAH